MLARIPGALHPETRTTTAAQMGRANQLTRYRSESTPAVAPFLGVHVMDTLTAVTNELKKTTKALDAAVEPITARYDNLAIEVERQAASLENRGSNLARTAETIQRKNAELLAEVRNLNWMTLVAMSVVILLVGLFGGITWEQHNVGDLVVNLENQIAQLQKTVKIPSVPAQRDRRIKSIARKNKLVLEQLWKLRSQGLNIVFYLP